MAGSAAHQIRTIQWEASRGPTPGPIPDSRLVIYGAPGAFWRVHSGAADVDTGRVELTLIPVDVHDVAGQTWVELPLGGVEVDQLSRGGRWTPIA